MINKNKPSKKENSFEEVYEKALSMLDYSPKTEKMLNDKLMQKGYSRETIKKVIIKLKDLNLLNDAAYGRIYAESLAKNKNLGTKNILMKLKIKGIDNINAKDLAEEAVISTGGEESMIINFIKKKSYIFKKLFTEKQLDKIKSKLFNNGFSFNAINKAVKQLKEEGIDFFDE